MKDLIYDYSNDWMRHLAGGEPLPSFPRPYQSSPSLLARSRLSQSSDIPCCLCVADIRAS